MQFDIFVTDYRFQISIKTEERKKYHNLFKSNLQNQINLSNKQKKSTGSEKKPSKQNQSIHNNLCAHVGKGQCCVYALDGNRFRHVTINAAKRKLAQPIIIHTNLTQKFRWNGFGLFFVFFSAVTIRPTKKKKNIMKILLALHARTLLIKHPTPNRNQNKNVKWRELNK